MHGQPMLTCRKIGQGHHRVMIYATFVELHCLMLHATNYKLSVLSLKILCAFDMTILAFVTRRVHYIDFELTDENSCFIFFKIMNVDDDDDDVFGFNLNGS